MSNKNIAPEKTLNFRPCQRADTAELMQLVVEANQPITADHLNEHCGCCCCTCALPARSVLSHFVSLSFSTYFSLIVIHSHSSSTHQSAVGANWPSKRQLWTVKAEQNKTTVNNDNSSSRFVFLLFAFTSLLVLSKKVAPFCCHTNSVASKRKFCLFKCLLTKVQCKHAFWIFQTFA